MIRRFATYTAINTINILVSLAMMLFLANALNVNEYAKIGVYGSFLALVIVVINFGHREALFKFSSKKATSLLAVTVRSGVRLVLTGGGLFILLGLYSVEVMLAGFYLLLLHVLQLAAAINRGQENIYKDAGAILLYRIGWLLFAVLIYYTNNNMITASMIFLAGIVSSLFVIPIVGNKKWFSSKTNDHQANRHAIPIETLKKFFKIEILTMLYMKLDIIILSLYRLEPELIAKYFFSLQLLEAALLLMTPLAYLFFNSANQAFRLQTGYSLYRPLFLTFFLSVSGVLLWTVIGDRIIELGFPKYVDSYSLSVALLCSAIPASFNMVLSYQVVARNLEGQYSLVMLLGAIVMTAMMTGLVPFLGLYAPVAAKIVAEIAMCLTFLYLLNKPKADSEVEYNGN